MKKLIMFMFLVIGMFSCSNDQNDENAVSQSAMRAGYRFITGHLEITNPLRSESQLVWEISSIDFIGDEIISPILGDSDQTTFSGNENLGGDSIISLEIIKSPYLLNLISLTVEQIDVNFTSLYAEIPPAVDGGVAFEITVEVYGNREEGLLNSTTSLAAPTKEIPFTVSVDMREVAEHDNYDIRIYIQTVEDCQCNGGIVKDLEGNAYTFCKFGEAGYWMTQNLRSTYNNLVILTENINNGNVVNQTYYYYPNNDASLVESHPEFGLLYSYKAATAAQNITAIDQANNPNQPVIQGICPEGWHLPSDYEWNELEQEIIRNPSLYSSITEVQPWQTSWATSDEYRGSHGHVLISQTPVNGMPSNGASKSAYNGGFDALLVGNNYAGIAYYFDYGTLFWSSSAGGKQAQTNGYARIITSEFTGVYRHSSWASNLLSVRCVKDE